MTPAWASGNLAYREERVWLDRKAEVVLRCISLSPRDKLHDYDWHVIRDLMAAGFASSSENGVLGVTPLGQQWLDKPRGAVH